MLRPEPSRRRGLTMIETTVILAVAGVLVAAVLIWLSYSREAARRLDCHRNLMQLSLATAMYAQSNGVLPPSGRPSPAGVAVLNDFSMKVLLLPYMEQVSVYNSVNFHHPSRSPEQFTVLTLRVWSFNCPSDANDPSGTMTVGGQSGEVASSSYANNLGTFLGNHGGTLDGPSFVYPDGDEGLGEPITIDGVTDGLARTVVFGEVVKGTNRTGTSGLHQTYAMTRIGYDGPRRAIDLDAAVADCRASSEGAHRPPDAGWDRKGSWWTSGNSSMGGGYSQIAPPNAPACYFRGSGPAPHYSMIGASSNHSGGVNVAFLDGSTAFVADAIAPAVWRALATRAGGEPIAPGSY